MRRHGLAPVADARPEDQGADERGDAGVGVHDRAAGEVDGAPLEGEARHRAGRRSRWLCASILARPAGLRHLARGVGDGIGAGPVPDHVRDGEIDERHPEDHEDDQRGKLHALGEGADDQRRRDRGKRHLEPDVGVLGHIDAVGERRRLRARRHAAQERLRQPADPVVELAAVGEREAVAVEHPDHAHEADDGEHLHQHADGVLGAHEAAVEQRQARDGHQQDQHGRQHQEAGVALVGRGERRRRRERERNAQGNFVADDRVERQQHVFVSPEARYSTLTLAACASRNDTHHCSSIEHAALNEVSTATYRGHKLQLRIVLHRRELFRYDFDCTIRTGKRRLRFQRRADGTNGMGRRDEPELDELSKLLRRLETMEVCAQAGECAQG